MKHIAIFKAEAWVNDSAIEVDAQGATAWDVTQEIQAASPELRASYLQGRNFESDQLREVAHAPHWVKTWEGPFEIRVEEMQDDAAADFLKAHGERPEHQGRSFAEEIADKLSSLIPDRDGRWGRGLRDGVESMSLALLQSGVDRNTVMSAIDSVMDAFDNNEADPTASGVELHDLMIVSTGHLTPEERTMIDEDTLDQLYVSDADPEGDAHIIVSYTGDYGGQLYIPSQGKGGAFGPHAYEAAYPGVSAGFAGLIRRAVLLGCEYVRFDTDAELIPLLPHYD